MLIVIVFLVGVAVSSLLRHQEEVETESHSNTPDNQISSDTTRDITVSQKSQGLSGISTEKLVPAKIRDRVKVFGEVMDLQSLIEMQNSYAIAEAAVERANAQIKVSRNEYTRVKKLFDFNRNVSQKDLQIAEAGYVSDQADSQSAAQNVSGLQGQIRQQWGKVVYGWIAQSSTVENEVVQGRISIFLLVIPPGDRINNPPFIADIVMPDGEQIRATLVSASPRTDPSIQGDSYFYKSQVGQELASGSNVVAYLPAGREASGVIIPASAVVWFNGKPLFYLKKGSDTFTPFTLSERDFHNGEWFLTSGVKAGQEVVVRGAQLLLSQGSKIKSGGDDD